MRTLMKEIEHLYDAAGEDMMNQVARMKTTQDEVFSQLGLDVPSQASTGDKRKR